LNDVLNLIPLVKGLLSADASRMAMVGVSRGGMMAYLALTRTHEVKAAHAIGAPSARCDWWWAFKPSIHDEPGSYFASPPIHFAYLINTPILIQHGGADPHRPVVDARLIAAGLDYYGKAHRLSIYEGGNHNLSTHRPEAFEERLDWMASHLQSP
jgi:dipeptidyl aminopeptidase/acylaminoacyl peptidase